MMCLTISILLFRIEL